MRLTQAWAKVWGRGSSAPQAPAAPSSGHPWERQVCKGLGLFQVPPYPGTTLPTHLPTVESARGSPTPHRNAYPLTASPRGLSGGRQHRPLAPTQASVMRGLQKGEQKVGPTQLCPPDRALGLHEGRHLRLWGWRGRWPLVEGGHPAGLPALGCLVPLVRMRRLRPAGARGSPTSFCLPCLALPGEGVGPAVCLHPPHSGGQS